MSDNDSGAPRSFREVGPFEAVVQIEAQINRLDRRMHAMGDALKEALATLEKIDPHLVHPEHQPGLRRIATILRAAE